LNELGHQTVKVENDGEDSEREDIKESASSKVSQIKFDFSWVIPCKGKKNFRRWALTHEEMLKTALLTVKAEHHDQYMNTALRLAFSN